MDKNKEINIFDDITELLFNKLGIETSIMLLYDYLKEFIHFDHLIFTWLDYTNKMWIPVIELDEGEPTHSTPQCWNELSNNATIQFIEHHGILRLDDLLVYKDTTDFFLNTIPTRRSMLSMIIHNDSESLISISIGSKQPGAFKEEEEILFAQLRVVFKNLTKNFSVNYYSRFSYLGYKGNTYDLIKQCNGLKNTLRYVETAAKTSQIVLINGETGVGKDLVAKAIHELSDRAKNNFIVCNCSAIPETLIDSEFFGYEKGAFTGAVSNKIGYFEQASEGTIFLDEIGELSLLAQGRLLRILETQEVRRIGGVRNININTRIITATNRDLEKMVAEGKFREDLWYRLNVISITVPSLRVRRGDVIVLVQYFLQQCMQRKSNTNVQVKVTSETYNKLCAYDWPGNVRQLRNSVEKAYFNYLMNGNPNLEFEEIKLSMNKKNVDINSAKLQDKNIEWIVDALKKSKGIVAGEKGAANMLDLNPNTLRTKMRKYNIKPSDYK